MKKERIVGCILIFILLIWFSASLSWADGGYVSKVRVSRSVAVSADQRAIIIKNGNEISMTFSTGYTGDGDDFGWIIPTPVPPVIEDVSEVKEKGENAFEILDKYTAPKIITYRYIRDSSCFPGGTEVLTASGPRAIETVGPGTEVYVCDLAADKWVLSKVLKRQSHQYEGDMITIRMGWLTIKATGNHPFYVISGDQLASRPQPQDIPTEYIGVEKHGRWVEARDLKKGDVLKDKSGEGLIITALSSWYEKTKVYNLEVAGYHNYAVHQRGILVHNKEKGEGAEMIGSSASLVTVYGTVTLKHYKVSVLGAADASALLEWLQENGYQVSVEAQDVLDTYIEQNWAFVAVKLNPSVQRHYENEFLTPLNIKYRYDELVFPLHISSISTTQTIKIVLYVIGESTVSVSNLPIATLKYGKELYGSVDPENYVEACIRHTLASLGGQGLVVMWSGELVQTISQRRIFNELIKTSFTRRDKRYVTRLETRMGPESMTKDIILKLGPQPRDFEVNIYRGYGDDYTYHLEDSLIGAIEDRDIYKVQNLLEIGADANAMDSVGNTALIKASEVGHKEMVKFLIEAGADVNAENLIGETALMRAAWIGYAEIVQILLDAWAQVNAKDIEGETTLMKAASAGQAELVQLLLEAGIDANEMEENEWNDLLSWWDSGHIETVKILLEVGADVNARNLLGETVLMKAAYAGQTEIVQILLEAGADVNATDKSGHTALIHARRGNHYEIVDMLLETEIEVKAMDEDSWTALMKAVDIGNIETVRNLLETDIDVNAMDKDGWTVLLKAAEKGYTEIVQILLDSGADVNKVGCRGYTALIFASRMGYPEITQLLIEAGADVDKKNNRGYTSLMWASVWGHVKVVELLLEAGADVDVQDPNGYTALHWADHYGHTEVAGLLKDVGARE